MLDDAFVKQFTILLRAAISPGYALFAEVALGGRSTGRSTLLRVSSPRMSRATLQAGLASPALSRRREHA